MIESLYNCYHVASFSTIQFDFFQMTSNQVEGNYRDKQKKFQQNKQGFQASTNRFRHLFQLSFLHNLCERASDTVNLEIFV